MDKVVLYAYTYDEATDTYNINPKPIHKFKNMEEFDRISGIWAMTYFMGHPWKGLGFCYCYKGQDITNKENLKLVSYGFMED